MATPFMWFMSVASSILIAFVARRSLNTLTGFGWFLALMPITGLTALVASLPAAAFQGSGVLLHVLVGVGAATPLAGAVWFFAWYFRPNLLFVPGRRKRHFL